MKKILILCMFVLGSCFCGCDVNKDYTKEAKIEAEFSGCKKPTLQGKDRMYYYYFRCSDGKMIKIYCSDYGSVGCYRHYW